MQPIDSRWLWGKRSGNRGAAPTAARLLACARLRGAGLGGAVAPTACRTGGRPVVWLMCGVSSGENSCWNLRHEEKIWSPCPGESSSRWQIGGRRGEAGHTVAHHHPLLNSIDESAATLNQGTVRRLPKRRQRGGRGPWAGGIAPAPLLSLSLSLSVRLSLSLSCIGV